MTSLRVSHTPLRVAKTTTGLLMVALTVLAFSLPGSGAGTPSIDKLIPKTLEPGWKLMPASALTAAVDSANKTESKATGQRVLNASEGWKTPSSSATIVATLARFPDGVSDTVRTTEQFATSSCVSMTGASASRAKTDSQIRASEEVTCPGKSSTGKTVSGISISWVYGDLLVGLKSVGLSSSNFNAVARRYDVSLAKAEST